MKKVLLIALLLGTFNATAIQAENRLSIPEDAIGINEDVYKDLKRQTCDVSENGYDVTCDEWIDNLRNKIVFRAQHLGELYYVGTRIDNNQKASVLLTPYLPDGFYKTKKNLFWVSNNSKVKIRKGQAYRTIIEAVQGGFNIAAIDQKGFTKIMTTCEYYGTGDPYQDPQFNLCVEEQNAGIKILEQNRGKVLLLSENDGMLAYAPMYTPLGMQFIDKKMDSINGSKPVKAYKYFKDEAIRVDRSLIKHISPYNYL